MTSKMIFARAFMALFAVGAVSVAHAGLPSDIVVTTATVTADKQIHLAATINRVPAGNDFNDPNSEFCFQRSAQNENFIAFWAKVYGDDPKHNDDPRKQFDIQDALSEANRFFNYYIDELKYVERGNSVSDKNKFVMFIFGDLAGTAFGGGTEGVGMMWYPAARMNRKPYCTIAHELGHSFQFTMRQDFPGSGIGAGYNEMQAQWFLWNVYPEWLTYENYHLVDYMRQTHLAFQHRSNIYHSPHVLEYWSMKHGNDFVAKLSRESKGEDAATVYKRIVNVDQGQFNDMMFDAYRRFITWDMPRIERYARQYANQHHTSLNGIGGGWYRIAEAKTPQNYGYNGIKLNVPAPGTKVTVDFKGIAGAAGYANVNLDKAGWRYGFVAYKKGGERVYSDVFSAAKGKAEFKVPDGTEYLWLVVMGAPTEHSVNPTEADAVYAQFPYEIRVKGATINAVAID